MAPTPSLQPGVIIKAEDYNAIQTAIAKIYGTGSGTFGYGQTLLSAPVATGQLIQDEHFAYLKTEALRISTHAGIQNDTRITSLPNVSQFFGKIVEADDFNKFKAIIDYLNESRFLLGPGQYSDESFSPNISQVRTTGWGDPQHNTIKHAFTIDFGTADNARYFFNSGGQLRFSASRTGGSATAQNIIWSNALAAMGTVVFNYSSCSGSSGTGSNIGFYQLTKTAQQVYSRAGTGVYTMNDYKITVSCDVNDNSAGGARYMYVTAYFNDNHEGFYTSKYPLYSSYESSYYGALYKDDYVDGTLTHTVQIRRATGTNVEVVAPTAILTTALSS